MYIIGNCPRIMDTIKNVQYCKSHRVWHLDSNLSCQQSHIEFQFELWEHLHFSTAAKEYGMLNVTNHHKPLKLYHQRVNTVTLNLRNWR